MWRLLNDPGVLGRITPGLKRLELIEPDGYRAIFHIKMGPIDTEFEGSMRVTEKVALEGYKLNVDVDAKIGIVNAEGLIGLREEGEGTVVTFSGDAAMSGKLAQLGQRVMSGVGRLFTNQFFNGLEKEIAPVVEAGAVVGRSGRDENTHQTDS